MEANERTSGPGPEFLTTRELAGLLRIKERKVYELVAAGGLPCLRVTGKLLFPRAGIEAWLRGHGASEPAAAQPPAVLAGSYDPLLEWALRESGADLALRLDGSADGLARLARSEASAAGIHLPDPDGAGWNLTAIEQGLPGQPVVALEWAWREQGLLLSAGNPHGIRGLADLPGRRLVPRQAGAGSQVLLQSLVARAGLAWDALTLHDPPARSEADLAQAIAEGVADCGFGLATFARQHRLDFLPLARERYDLVVWRRAYFEPPLQRLLTFCASARFRARAEALAGYDVAGLGQVRFNGP
jgi:excisionase family DNA binding protein